MTKSEYANLMGLHTYSPVYDQKAELDADFVKTVKGIMEIVYKKTELVQCKDCRYCSITPVASVGATYECLRFRRRFGITMNMMPTDFCSKGQRRPAKNE